MVIIIEGIDRVGKSTLCKILSKSLGYKIFRDNFYINTSVDSEEIKTEKGNTLVNLIEQGIVDNVILDRFHWSEYVYGAYERKYTNMQMIDIEKRLTKCKNIAMILVRPIDIKKSSEEHGKNLSRHDAAFKGMFSLCDMQKFEVDYNGIIRIKNYISTCENIMDLIKNITKEKGKKK